MRHTIQHLLLTGVALLGATSATFGQNDDPVTKNRPARNLAPDRMEPVPPQVLRDTKDVGITEHLGSTIPLDLPFTDTTGRSVKLADYFKHGRPVIVQLGYFNCPQLCDKVSQELMEGVKGLPLELGKDYDMLYVSVNPDERWELGQAKKRNYVEEFGKPGAIGGWNFLVGKDPSIKPLAEAIGFGYRKVEGRDEWSHPPMIAVLTADGKISRYFYGWEYPSVALKQGIEEAGQGKVGSYVEQIIIALCYHQDEYSGKYSWSYMKLMQGGALLSALVVFSWLGTRWIRDARAGGSPPPVTHS